MVDVMRSTRRVVLQFTLPAVVLSAIAIVSYLSVPGWHTRTIQRWIRTHSLRIAGLDPSLNVDDLESLGAHLQDVQIVALGEQSHGTHEFFLLKHRLLKYLVTRLGFRAFVLEASRARCRPINDYVLHGKGNLGDVVHRQGFFTWDTREMADLIQWIHNYNRGVPDTQKVQFFGMDPQLPEIDTIEAYVKSAGTRDAELALKSLALVDTEIQNNPFLTQLTAERGVDLQKASTNVETFFDTHREQLVHRDVSQFNIIREDAHQLTEAIEAARDPRLFFEKRDTYMAENVRDLLSQLGPQSRIVIWAHNYHVSSVRAPHSVLPMGELLRKWYGPAYFAVGFSFGTGTLRAKRSQDLKTPAIAMMTHPPDQGSIDDNLGHACADGCTFPYLLVLRQADDKAPHSVQEWLRSTQSMRSIGAVYDPVQRQPVDTYHLVLIETFDCLVYVPKSSPSLPLSP
jgi:erythromycin esterase